MRAVLSASSSKQRATSGESSTLKIRYDLSFSSKNSWLSASRSSFASMTSLTVSNSGSSRNSCRLSFAHSGASCGSRDSSSSLSRPISPTAFLKSHRHPRSAVNHRLAPGLLAYAHHPIEELLARFVSKIARHAFPPKRWDNLSQSSNVSFSLEDAWTRENSQSPRKSTRRSRC